MTQKALPSKPAVPAQAPAKGPAGGAANGLAGPAKDGSATAAATPAAGPAKDPISRLRERRAAAQLGGGVARIQAQHDKGKYTARERIDLLCDPDTFVEVDAFVRTQATNFGLDKG